MSGRCSTYLMKPGQFVRSGIRSDVALEVNIGALLDIFRIQSGTYLETGDGRNCNQKIEHCTKNDKYNSIFF